MALKYAKSHTAIGSGVLVKVVEAIKRNDRTYFVSK